MTNNNHDVTDIIKKSFKEPSETINLIQGLVLFQQQLEPS